ncbi:hypothetical protein AGLY_004857 [Aphis glycines]|uniref:Reverse transcriptase domain-containing protein n=1 Tax=Aphis glycines TaxID=307491 RepID=A0A6G0TV24_APHGL|nr:hypothetical protein AGLY_004857 [Aphis glycines]
MHSCICVCLDSSVKNSKDNTWNLEQIYEGPKLTGQEIKHDEKVLKNWLNYGVLRKEFDKILRDLKRKKFTGIEKIQAKLWKESEKNEHLLTHVSKVLTMIMSRRMENNIQISSGCRKNVITREAILALRTIIEKRIRKDNSNDVAWEMLKRVFIDYTERRLIFKLYQKGTAAIQFGKIEEETRLRKGVRQGCTLFPSIFNTYIQEAIDTMREIWMNGRKMYMLRFTDNIAVLAESKELQRMLYVRNSAQ